MVLLQPFLVEFCHVSYSYVFCFLFIIMITSHLKRELLYMLLVRLFVYFVRVTFCLGVMGWL